MRVANGYRALTSGADLADCRDMQARAHSGQEGAGDGWRVGEERCDDPAVAKLCASSFEAAWDRAIPYEAYQPT